MNATYRLPKLSSETTQNSLSVEGLRIKHITSDQERLSALEELLNRVQAQIINKKLEVN